MVGFWMGEYRLKTGAREYGHGVCIRCKYPSENMIKYAYITRSPTDWHAFLSRNLPPYRIQFQLAVRTCATIMDGSIEQNLPLQERKDLGEAAVAKS
jgi:hypothetical protein